MKKNFKDILTPEYLKEHYIQKNKRMSDIAKEVGCSVRTVSEYLHISKFQIHTKLKDLSGKKFGKLLVKNRTSNDRNGSTKWRCLCDCGKITEVYAGHLIRGQTRSCGCGIVQRGNKHIQWTGYGEISGGFWNSIKDGASGKRGKRTPIEFNISIEYAWNLFLKQNRQCALTNLPLTLNFQRKSGQHTASLDRIDSSKGYIEGNVQWVHKDVNMMKRIYNQDYFINICKLVSQKFSA